MGQLRSLSGSAVAGVVFRLAEELNDRFASLRGLGGRREWHLGPVSYVSCALRWTSNAPFERRLLGIPPCAGHAVAAHLCLSVQWVVLGVHRAPVEMLGYASMQPSSWCDAYRALGDDLFKAAVHRERSATGNWSSSVMRRSLEELRNCSCSWKFKNGKERSVKRGTRAAPAPSPAPPLSPRPLHSPATTFNPIEQL